MTKKRALLAGINDYSRISDLRGCLNDIKNIRDVLKTYYGFENKDIRVLTDSRATRENILHRMDWLADGAQAGDQLFFHYSGHGSQVRDRDGDELRDNNDEIICCYGMTWSGGYILDDEFDSFFKSLPEQVKMEMILDSCHSGTGNSIVPRQLDMGDPDTHEQTKEVKGRYLEPPLDIELRSEGDDLEVKRFVNAVQPKTTSQGSTVKKHVIWSGCGEQQTSADAYIKNSFNGAFTYYFCKAIRQANGNITRNDLLKKLRSSIKYNQYTQIPELTCEDVVANQVFLK